MGAEQNFDWQATAASALEWWREAGVDAAIGETPYDWLAPPAPALLQPAAVTTPAAVAATTAIPATLAAFIEWRAGPDAPEAGWHGRALPAQGDPAADIMILIEMPERDDAESGILMSGAPGRLFDRMLAAIGRRRDSVYLLSLCTVRPAAGRIAPEAEAALSDIAVRHVALAAPKRLLVMGNAPSRALLGVDTMRARGGLRALNLKAGTIVSDVGAVASFHPRFLLDKPAAKAEAWKDLQMLIEGLEA